jgi:aminoglycoside 6'-N-acetyltransferase
MTAYAFRPMSASDLSTIQRWLGTPHVLERWHDPAEQFELVSGDLCHLDMAQFIVAVEAQEFAYLQCYNLSACNSGFGPQPEGTRGLDQFIGEADMLNRGHGSAFIPEFARGTPSSEATRVYHGPCRLGRRRLPGALHQLHAAGQDAVGVAFSDVFRALAEGPNPPAPAGMSLTDVPPPN